MVNKLLSALKTTGRMLKNIALRPIRTVYSKIRYLFSAGRLTSAIPGAVKKLPKILKTKPEKREDYFDWGSVYVAKSLVITVTVIIIAVVLAVIFFIYPLFISLFGTKDFILGDENIASYSGKVTVYYDGEFENIEFAGRLKDGKPVEYGEEYYENGQCKYMGNYADGLYGGEGTQYREDGSVIYRGAFSGGLYNGDGEYSDESGNVLAGSFTDGKLNGTGTLSKNGTLYYEGNFADGEINGEGRILYQDGTVKLAGTFSGGVLNGEGREYFADNTLKYSGGFADGLYEGSGALYLENSAKLYSGGFEKGKYSGNGTLYNAYGAKLFSGEFEDGAYNGNGTLYGADGSVTTGTFANGEISGAAKRVFSNGTEYEGLFTDGQLNGAGRLSDITGAFSYTGTFLDNGYDYREILGSDSTAVQSAMPSLTRRVESDCFYLEDKEFGVVMRCGFAQGDNPAKVLEMFDRPIGGITYTINSVNDISAPNADSIAEVKDKSLPQWASAEFGITASNIKCFAAYYDGLVVYYWTDGKTGTLLLRSGEPAETENPDKSDKTDEAADPTAELGMDEIKSIFDELGLDINDFAKTLGIETDDEQSVRLSAAASVFGEYSETAAELNYLLYESLDNNDLVSEASADLTQTEASDSNSLIGPAYSETMESEPLTQQPEESADNPIITEEKDAGASKAYSELINVANEYQNAALSAEKELSESLVDYDVMLKKLKILIGRYSARLKNAGEISALALVGEYTKQDVSDAEKEAETARLEIIAALSEISALKESIEKQTGVKLKDNYDFDGVYYIINPLETDGSELSGAPCFSSICVPNGVERKEYQSEDISLSNSIKPYYTLCNAITEYISAVSAEREGEKSRMLGEITEKELSALTQAREEKFLAAIEAKADLSKTLFTPKVLSARTESAGLLRSTIPENEKGVGFWSVYQTAGGAELCPMAYPSAESDKYKIKYNGKTIGSAKIKEPCAIKAAEYKDGENYAEVQFYKDGELSASYYVSVFAPYGEFLERG